MEDDYKLYGSDEGVIDEVADSEDDEFDDSVGYSSSDESKILYTLSPLTDEEIIKLFKEIVALLFCKVLGLEKS